ncbi:uncharacterized protein GGS25DRAFT_490999, partial [Hypoxylon fragiforme]|uniref:uncharacterized protein n=1 Tax=Hypoxylon fragiforme TaxID=63214 RepID=UPI0020C6C783
MPHKHTRREKDPSTYDLPPSQIAKPLPVKPQAQKDNNNNNKKKSNQKTENKKTDETGSKNLKRKRSSAPKDDAPRAFKKLMAFAGGKRPRAGLDNGDEPTGKSKKNKKNKSKNATATTSNTEAGAGADAEAEAEAESQPKPVSQIPTIKPGERMSEFAARVDAALPVGGLINNSIRNGKDPLGLKTWRTKKEMKMHKLYAEWREEERKLKEKHEEALEEEAEKELEEEEAGVTWKLDPPTNKKKGKKGKKTRYLGEVADGDDDPWQALKKKRGETRAGLHDVVQAPPEFTVRPQQRKMTVRGAAVEIDGIPKAAGSLRRREELQIVRDDILAAYRKRMSEKRPSLHAAAAA